MTSLYRHDTPRRPGRPLARLAGSGPWLALACLLAAAGCGPSRPEQPNVLLVVLSGARPDHMSAYGYRRATTPELAKLASGGTLFETAITPAPWPLTAQASLATGLYPSEHAAAFDHPILEPKLETLAEKLKAAGYDTFGATTDEQMGSGNGFAQGFDVFKEVRPTEHGMPDEGAAATESELLGWLAARTDRQRPWFAMVTLVNPRLPFNPQGDYQQKFLEHPLPLPQLQQMTQLWIPFARQFTLNMVSMAPDGMAAMGSLYDGEIAYTDYRLGRIADALAKDRILDDTLVIVTGDSGEDLGDHGALADMQNVWDSIVRVPLVMRLPGRVPAGRRETAQVQTVDLMDAVMKLTAPAGGADAGKSDASPVRPRPAAIIEARFDPAALHYYRTVMPAADAEVFQRNLLAVRTSDMKFILNSRGAVALFDLKADPQEKRSIAQDRPDDAREMNARLNAWASGLKAPFAAPVPAPAGDPAGAASAPPPSSGTTPPPAAAPR